VGRHREAHAEGGLGTIRYSQMDAPESLDCGVEGKATTAE
jgi:hypothetical protein